MIVVPIISALFRSHHKKLSRKD